MNLPAPPSSYSQANEAALRRALEQEDRRNRKADVDVELGRERLVLKSPDGTRFSVTVSNAGILSATAL
jgi:hypothetical protein